MTTGSRDFTSVALPGQVSEQIGRPSSSTTTPTITWCSSGRWSSTCHAGRGTHRRRRRTSARVVSNSTTERSLNRLRRHCPAAVGRWPDAHTLYEDRDLQGQSSWLVNYARRYRSGLRAGKSITEVLPTFWSIAITADAMVATRCRPPIAGSLRSLQRHLWFRARQLSQLYANQNERSAKTA